jgi:F1F0 ATPase subunit 2
MKHDVVLLPIAFLAGTAIGLYYFGLLWWTIRRIPRARHPAALVTGSFVVRIGVALAAFAFVMNGRWERMAACLAGFLLVRQLMIARVRPTESDSNGGPRSRSCQLR